MTGVENSVSGDVFNARDLTAPAVAQSFIPPAAFGRLTSDAHCVLEGPRGSGKTTLLRMLTAEAFALWRAYEPGSDLSFIGIFVPADIRWAKQLKLRVDRIADPLAQEALQQAAFSGAISLAFLGALERSVELAPQYFSSHPALFLPLSSQQEVSIVQALGELWQLKVSVPSFNGLRFELRKRQRDLAGIGLQLATGTSLADALGQGGYLATTWLDNIVNAIETVNELLERPGQRWAILLDELEIIPKDLLKNIVDALRSTSPLLRFKLALSPSGSELLADGDPSAPTPLNDYRPVRLWYSNRDEARIFAERLFTSAMVRMGLLESGCSLQSVLPLSVAIGSGDAEGETVIEEGLQSSPAHKARIAAFTNLYLRDESFKALLDEKEINPENPPISSKSLNGTLVRDITPFVIHRERELEKFVNGKATRKGGRKGYHGYLGYPSLIDLTEANPRWVLTLAEALGAASKEGGLPISSQTVQGRAISGFVQQFASKLMVYPVAGAVTGRRWTPLQFIQALGDSIAGMLFDGPFKQDMPMSFTVDQRAIDQFGEYVRTCIDLGALVILRRGSSAPLSAGAEGHTLVGSRVRISYRLAPYFRLPLRSTKERSLSTALKSGELLLPKNIDKTMEAQFSSEQRLDVPIQGRLL